MTKNPFWALLSLVSLPVFALVPPDYHEPQNNLRAEVEAGFQLNTGNTDSTSFNGRTKLVYDAAKTKQEGTVKAYYAADDQGTTNERYDLEMQSNYKLSRGYILASGNFTWDKFGSYTNRYTFVSGYGFDIVSTGRTKLSIEVGPGYRYSMPQETDDEPNPEADREPILRTKAKFEQLIHEYTTFNADLSTEIGATNNTVILDLNYKNTLFQDWAFKVGFKMEYNQNVGEGSEQTDTITTFNLLYTFQ
ncbi:DUF481 domain-containing protein [Shewanella avicenniae]|uniref:DUF481 domain-containing protein n=1 Tax=Shewanella avicenniae TaxID=2814294 RepID=A0ABX7QRK5_9GAMM|nr:DUF481 domain-containing protein [Shewanella avicenniae]QSX34081.1 DUF481 domain-containing protein [Shewanella avicenniae]